MRKLDELEAELLSAPPELTDDGLALELTRRCGGDLLYVHEWG